jgi:DNA modification methylase
MERIDFNTIHNEDCRKTMKRIQDNSIDSIVTDSPYELGFMEKQWDRSGISYNVKMWRECLRILKPGGHLCAFGGTRTSHRMVCAIEDAGFEIRDSILWIYASGLPKNMDVSKSIDRQAGAVRTEIIGQKRDTSDGKVLTIKQRRSGADKNGNAGYDRPWKHDDNHCQETINIMAPVTDEAKEYDGWGTGLKPEVEPICLARKPLSEKTVAKNILKWGTGAININDCRVEFDSEADKSESVNKNRHADFNSTNNRNIYNAETLPPTNYNPQSGRFPGNVILDPAAAELLDKLVGSVKSLRVDLQPSRFFYIAKPDKAERHDGCYELDSKNGHETVKPIDLIQYLCRLVTPKGGIIYDPFAGSGTTPIAANNEGFYWIASELLKKHCDIAFRRIHEHCGLFK